MVVTYVHLKLLALEKTINGYLLDIQTDSRAMNWRCQNERNI